jgi:CBS domain-containing protein
MSARAACRLETLGYRSVYRYLEGKEDWLANGLPSEGLQAGEPRIGSLVLEDVPRCRIGQALAELDLSSDLYVVVNEDEVVLGDLRGKALRADPSTRVEEAMNPGPVTYRPNTSVHEMAHYLVDNDARRVLVTDADGRLIGLLRAEDVDRVQHPRRSGANGPVLAS